MIRAPSRSTEAGREPPSGRLPRPTAGHGVAALAAALAVLVYPFAAEAARTAWGVRPLAALVLALGASTLVARAVFDRLHLRNIALEHGGAILLGALALLTGDGIWLLLFPVLVNATLCGVFIASLREDPCIVEEVARWIEPHLPDFTRAYSRVLTGLWGGFFAVAAGGIAVVALLEPAWWRAATVPVYFGVIAALSVLEFVFRKIWFRHYTSRRIDQLFARVFPPEHTERGRRSLAYLQRMRELGLHRD
jgi:uncharacterized membrane protein